MSPADLWAFLPAMAGELAGFVFKIAAPLLCVAFGIAWIRKSAA